MRNPKYGIRDSSAIGCRPTRGDHEFFRLRAFGRLSMLESLYGSAAQAACFDQIRDRSPQPEVMIRIVPRRKFTDEIAFFSLLAASAMVVVAAWGEVSPARGQFDPSSDIRLSLETNSKFGILTYVPETWGDLHFRLDNHGDIPRELLCTTYFDENSALQFGRQVWLPAQCQIEHFPSGVVPDGG